MQARAGHAAPSPNRAQARPDMDINHEYAAHQSALMQATSAGCADQRQRHFATASRIAGRISAFQRELGAAAACAWGVAHLLAPAPSAAQSN